MEPLRLIRCLAFQFVLFIYGSRNVLSSDQVSLLFVGDITFTGPVKYHVEHNHTTYNDSFAEVASFIREADISVGNFESSFVNDEVLSHEYQDKSVVLDSSPKSVSSLRFAGFDAVTVANNHLNDFGDAGANFTAHVLQDGGMNYFGISYGPFDSSQTPLILERKGLKIGFLGYCDITILSPPKKNCSELRMMFNSGPAIYSEDIAERDIKKLKSEVDIVVVYIHWGRELILKPVPRQFRVTQHLLSLGVHVIIGSHSHVLQQHFYRDKKTVAFSLGNFLFSPGRPHGGHNPRIYGRFGKTPDQDLIDAYETIVLGNSEFLKESELFRVKVSKKGVEYADYLPVKLTFDSVKKNLHVKPTLGGKWIEVCSEEDKLCQRT